MDYNKHTKKVLDLIHIDHSKFPEAILENLNIPYLIGMYFFRKKGVNKKNEIDFIVDNKINYSSNINTHYNFFKRFVKIECPVCLKDMGEPFSGGGSSNFHHTDYKCSVCQTKVSLGSFADGGFNLEFVENQ